MYTAFYGLRDDPFLLTPDHRFYFESQVHAQAMAHLLYGLQRSEGFIVITGEVGAGKTTIVQHLCATLDNQKIVAAHVVSTLLSGPELLRTVCAAFGISDIPVKKDAVLRRLQAYFSELASTGRRALLVVDEAQNLSVGTLEELRMLSNFQIGNVSPCQTFLVGQPQFRKTLGNPDLEQLRQRVIAAYHLSGLSSDECGRYVTHRMTQAGWTNDPTFEHDAMQAIYLHSGGMPRVINTLCSRILLLGFLDNLHVFRAEHVGLVAADLGEEIGEMTAKNGRPLSKLEGESALTERVNLMERELVLLRRVTTSLGKIVLEQGRQ